MTPINVNPRKSAPIAAAGRKVKGWITRSLTSAPRKPRQPPKRREATPATTTSSSSSAADLLSPGLKGAVNTTRLGQTIHDVPLPSETISRVSGTTDGVGLSGSSSSSSSAGLTDDDESSDPTSLDDEYLKPPTFPAGRCDNCEETVACRCLPAIPVAPPCPLQSSRPPSPTPSTSIDSSDAYQIPDEGAVQVEITHVSQEIDQQQVGSTGSGEVRRFRDLWAETQEGANQWGESQWGDCEVTVTWTELQDVSSPLPTFPCPAPAEPEEDSAILRSSDGRMTLTLRNFLGAGTYGRVVSADWAEGQRQLAVKVSHKLFISELDTTEPGLRALKGELDVLKALKYSREDRELGSNFFPELFKSWQDAKNVYFAMEMYPWNLEDLRWADPKWEVEDDDKILWAAEMILGVQALHRMRILHRDIKPANILITHSKHIVIGDYGVAHAWLDPFYADYPTTSLKARDAPGTMGYLAPEVVKGFYQDPVNAEVRRFASYGFEADIWSLGVTICETWRQGPGLFTLQEGENHLDPKSTIPSRILQMDVRPAVRNIVKDHPIWHLVSRMLDRNQRTRIGFNEMFAHPVFASLDWNRVANLEYTPTWSFPEAKPSKRPRPVADEIKFGFYYQSPEEIKIDDKDSERAKGNKLDRRHWQVIRRAMGATRDWVSNQQPWIADEVLGEYDFDWTAPEVIAEDEKWIRDD